MSSHFVVPKSLQQKIDDMECGYAGRNLQIETIDRAEVNKALQEFREQVIALRTKTGYVWDVGYNNALSDVLALIGEKKQ